MFYLMISPDGSKSVMSFYGANQIQARLDEFAAASAEGIPDPDFLDVIPVDKYGLLDPGTWPEEAVLILRVEVVVPRPVTQKWCL